MQVTEKLTVSGQIRSRETANIVRIADYVIACALIIATLPLMIFVAIAIKLETVGPILTCEERLARSGRRVTVFKFRVRSLHCFASSPFWQPEETQVGKLLVYLRIADLPQLLNVLRGELSFVDARQEHWTYGD